MEVNVERSILRRFTDGLREGRRGETRFLAKDLHGACHAHGQRGGHHSDDNARSDGE